MSKVIFGNMILGIAFCAFLVLLSAAPLPQKAFDFNFQNGFPGQGYRFPGGRFGYSGSGFQFNGNGFNGYGFNGYPINAFSILANGSIYNSATGDMINGFFVPSSSNSNSNNVNFATNPGIDVRVG